MRALRESATALASSALLLFVPFAAACGDDDRSVEDRAQDAASDAAESVDEKIDEGLARGQAELLRERIKDAADGDASLWPTVTIIEGAVEELPGNPTVSGVTDEDGDGLDDDGKVSLSIDESHACVAIGADDIDVSGDAC
jgi:hypothetical protein